MKTIVLTLSAGHPIVFTSTDADVVQSLYESARAGGWLVLDSLSTGGRVSNGGAVNWAHVVSFTVT